MILMRNPMCVLLFALMAALAWTTPARCADRSLVLLFGPTSAEHAQQAAHPVATPALNWLKFPGASAEIRPPRAACPLALAPFFNPRPEQISAFCPSFRN